MVVMNIVTIPAQAVGHMTASLPLKRVRAERATRPLTATGLHATFSVGSSPKVTCYPCNMGLGSLSSLVLRTDTPLLPAATPVKMSSSTGQPSWTTIHIRQNKGCVKTKHSSSMSWLVGKEGKQITGRHLKVHLFAKVQITVRMN